MNNNGAPNQSENVPFPIKPKFSISLDELALRLQSKANYLIAAGEEDEVQDGNGDVDYSIPLFSGTSVPSLVDQSKKVSEEDIKALSTSLNGHITLSNRTAERGELEDCRNVSFSTTVFERRYNIDSPPRHKRRRSQSAGSSLSSSARFYRVVVRTMKYSSSWQGPLDKRQKQSSSPMIKPIKSILKSSKDNLAISAEPTAPEVLKANLIKKVEEKKKKQSIKARFSGLIRKFSSLKTEDNEVDEEDGFYDADVEDYL